MDDDLDNNIDVNIDINNSLENQSDNEIDLDEMQSVDLKTKKKADPNTKFIFFKDVE